MAKSTLPTDGTTIEMAHKPEGGWSNWGRHGKYAGPSSTTTWRIEGQMGRDDGPGPLDCATCGENIRTGRTAISEGSSVNRPWHHLGCLSTEDVRRLTSGMPREPREIKRKAPVRLTEALQAPGFSVRLTEMAATAVLGEGDKLGFRAKADLDALPGLARQALKAEVAA